MPLKSIFLSFILLATLGVAFAHRVDGIEYGEAQNADLAQLHSAKTNASSTNSNADLVPIFQSKGVHFFISDKSMRHNWKNNLIVKVYKLYDTPKRLRVSNDPPQSKSAQYLASESIIEVDCTRRVYTLKAEALYSAGFQLVQVDSYPEKFIDYKPQSPIGEIHQQFCD